MNGRAETQLHPNHSAPLFALKQLGGGVKGYFQAARVQTSHVHPLLDIRTAQSTNKLFYNKADTTCTWRKNFIIIGFTR